MILATAARADDAEALIAAPTAVAIEPGDVVLRGHRASAQLIVGATYADGSLRDLTRALEWSSASPEVATVSATGMVTPRGDGLAVVTARRGSVEASTTVRVEGMTGPSPVSFRNDVVQAVSQAGCNSGACHGTPTGKGGLKLSLRGYLPDEDFVVLSRELGGRRINTLDADASVILRKPLGEAPHEGGIRLKHGTKGFEYIRDWIAEGAHDDPNVVAPVKLEALPGSRILNAPAKTQQVVVQLTMADGVKKDVTSICYYDSSSPDIAEVDANGFVTFKGRGEVAIIAHYLSHVAIVRLTHLIDVPDFQVVDVPQGNLVDQAVFAKLNHMRIAPSEGCSDAEFLRRAYLDVIGMLPKPDEVEAFLKESPGDRRARLIDALLERPEFHDFWALKFADVLRSNGRLIEPKGAYVFHRWIRACLESDMPMDEFVRKDQPRARGGRRDHGPTVPRRPDPVRQVPQPPLRALDAGRLLQLRRVFLPGRTQAGRAAGRGGRLQHRRRRGEAAAHRPGHAAEGPGRPGDGRPDGRPSRPVGDVADRP
jgi:hypothetical protein